jgi:ubiquinone/menaquinone biosynthesis C-methylase UbiE
VLDFGAGVGYSVPFFARHLPDARVTCLDVSRKSLEVGAAKHGKTALFQHFDGRRIPFDDGTFDVALASCVFHHIPHAEHVALLAEIRRVLAPGGRLFVFEHNPLNPLTRHAVNTCVFDEHAELVLAPTMRRRARDAGFAAAAVRYRIFFPHALRRLRRLEPRLTWLPLGAQYYVAARKAG